MGVGVGTAVGVGSGSWVGTGLGVSAGAVPCDGAGTGDAQTVTGAGVGVGDGTGVAVGAGVDCGVGSVVAVGRAVGGTVGVGVLARLADSDGTAGSCAGGRNGVGVGVGRSVRSVKAAVLAVTRSPLSTLGRLAFSVSASAMPAHRPPMSATVVTATTSGRRRSSATRCRSSGRSDEDARGSCVPVGGAAAPPTVESPAYRCARCVAKRERRCASNRFVDSPRSCWRCGQFSNEPKQ